MSLYLKYRPSALAEIKGNKEVVQTLDRLLENVDTCPHTFLLHGPTGCGKTTIARIIAKRLGISDEDTEELNTADMRGIDTIRDIIQKSQFLPIKGERRIWVIDESHRLTLDAQNALLKILEDYPKHVYFVLATTEPEKLLGTIKGRCSSFQLKQLEEEQMINLLKRVARAEGQKVDNVVLEQIAQDSLGHPRNALQILEQVLAVDKEQQLIVAQRSADQQSQIIELCRALLNGKRWNSVAEILNGLKGEEAESVRRAVLGYCQSVLLKGDNDRAGLIMELFIEPFYNSGFPGLIFACYSVVKSYGRSEEAGCVC